MDDWVPLIIVFGLFLVVVVAGLTYEGRERRQHNPKDPRCEFHNHGPRNMREVCHHPRCAARRAGFSH
jgi:hypothetical protein